MEHRKLKIISVCVAVFAVLSVLAICLLYPRIAFWWHYDVICNDYGEYEMVGVNHISGEEIILPEKTPGGDPITILTKIMPYSGYHQDGELTVLHYEENFTVKRLVIPDSYKQIRGGSTDNLFALESVAIGSGVELIYGGMFASNPEISELKVADGNPVYFCWNNCIIERSTNTVVLGCRDSVIPDVAEALGDAAFAGVEGLIKIEIPDSVNSIGQSCFGNCVSLEKVFLGDSIMFVGDGAFRGCPNLTVCCSAPQKPEKWSENWCDEHAVVVWGAENVD